MSAETAHEYRDLAWSNIEADSKKTLTTKKDEAIVAIIGSDNGGVMAKSDELKKKLEEIKAAGGTLVSVTYNTDQDKLIGPLTLVFDPSTKELIGHFIRK